MTEPGTRDSASPHDDREPRHGRSPFTVLAVFFVAGVLLGITVTSPRLWATLTCVLLVLAVVARLRGRGVSSLVPALLAATASAALWTCVRTAYVDADDIRHHLADTSQLARITGVVDSPPQITPAQQGAFGRFSYRPPVTYAVLDADTLETSGGDVRVSGRVLLKINQADHRLAAGSRIVATGWLSAISPPANPGEFDYARHMADRGIYARISLPHRENWSLVEPPSPSSFAAAIERLSNASSRSLLAGLSPDPLRSALLDALLLGRWNHNLTDLADDFRRTGLMHLLSISGAHLSILLGLAWAIGRAVATRPPRPVWIALAVLVFYLLVVPPQVPLMRAGIMAAAFMFAFATGRVSSGIEALSLSAIVVLVWRPQDITSPGAQLSFLGVASLLLFTRPLSQRLSPKPDSDEIAQVGQVRVTLRRWTADFISANIVASVISAPLIAYHFGMVCPLGAVLSMLILPVVTVVMSIGFLKLTIGSALPTVGQWLASPLSWSTDTFIGMVERGARTPGSSVELAFQPGAVWTIGATAVLAAIFAGWFHRRRIAFAGSLLLCGVWLSLPLGRANLDAYTASPRGALTLHAFAVGDGSCFLLRSTGADGRDRTLMFDCGSNEYLDLSRRSIAPSLQTLGVGRIDTLVISHADLDHFCGVLDLADVVPIGRVLVTPQLLAEARRSPGSAVSQLLRGLRDRAITLETVGEGWSDTLGDAELALIWPAADLVTPRNNDASAVLSVRFAGRRILLNGDIEQLAQAGLLTRGASALRADVADLPHHGSFVETSSQWLSAVAPRVVLQSTGAARLDRDKWADVIPPGVERLITHRVGAIRVDIDADGAIRTSTFRRLRDAGETVRQ